MITPEQLATWKRTAFIKGWRLGLEESEETILRLIEELEAVGNDPKAPEWLKMDSALRLHGLKSAAQEIRKLNLGETPSSTEDDVAPGGDEVG